MTEVFAELNIFLDYVHVGSADGFGFGMVVPTGRFPVVVERADGVIGRATIIFDHDNVAEAFADELYEPLDDVWLEGQLLLAGDAARVIWERDRPSVANSIELDPTGANVVAIPVESTTAEVGWWYGGDHKRADEGICALDIIWNPDLDPIDPDAPVRNMAAVIQNFFNERGPPSLRQEEE